MGDMYRTIEQNGLIVMAQLLVKHANQLSARQITELSHCVHLLNNLYDKTWQVKRERFDDLRRAGMAMLLETRNRAMLTNVGFCVSAQLRDTDDRVMIRERDVITYYVELLPTEEVERSVSMPKHCSSGTTNWASMEERARETMSRSAAAE